MRAGDSDDHERESEEQARQRKIPIVGPAVGTLLASLAESIGARRIFELGSAVGYSTAFFAQAVGREGRVFYTDGNPENAREAGGYLSRLGLLDRVEVRTGEAVELLTKSSGLFDVVFIAVEFVTFGTLALLFVVIFPLPTVPPAAIGIPVLILSLSVILEMRRSVRAMRSSSWFSPFSHSDDDQRTRDHVEQHLDPRWTRVVADQRM